MIPITPVPLSGTEAYRALLEREPVSEEVRSQTAALLSEVKARGDAAVRDLTERFDGVRLAQTKVPVEEIHSALRTLDPRTRQALEQAAEHIEAVHRAQRFQEEPVEVVRGVRVWRDWRPLDRVGIYGPGGQAAYSSSVLMLAVPAQLAGCREVVLCSPPKRDGRVPAPILAAAALAGVFEVHAVGGAQAIAAMAYGTESLRKVDKIVGPGNRYVTAAKLLVYGTVGIDMPAGPSEIVVVADGSVPAVWVAADLCAQAEHAADAVAILLTSDQSLAAAVQSLLGESLGTQVRILTAPDLAQLIDFAEALAPEHLTLACASPERWLSRIAHAGSIFLGAFAPAAAGDYATGANHVLPTGGAGRAFSGLGLEAFGRTLQIQAIDAAGLERLEPVVSGLAEAEGLLAHRDSVRLRLDGTHPDGAARGPRPRGAIERMQPYEWEPPSARIAKEAGVPEDEVIRFDTNTVPWPGASLAALPSLILHEYPDTSYAALTQALSAYTDAPVEAITIGGGADEILDLLAKAYVGPKDLVIISRPTYAMFRIVSEMAGGSVEDVPAADLSLDRDRFLARARHARLVWICNPNNPTGELVPLSFIEAVAESTPGVVAVDEAYFEFSGVTAVPAVTRLPNLVAVRTLSKGFGLAGVRVGYAIAGPAISAALRRVRPPGSVSVVSEALALRALGDQTGMRRRVTTLIEGRDRLRAELQGIGLGVRASAANFLLVRASDDLAPALLHRGMVVRTFPARLPLQGYVRITVRAPEENARLVQAIHEWRTVHAG